jgi:hypothetical protein
MNTGTRSAALWSAIKTCARAGKRRQQIEELHQARDISQGSRSRSCAQAAMLTRRSHETGGACAAPPCCATRAGGSATASAARQRIAAASARECQHDCQCRPIPHRRLDRQPPQAAAVGQVLQNRRRLKHDGARQRAGRQDRNELDADDKAGADHRGDDLRDEPRALGADRAKQRDRQQYRDRDRACANATTTP